MEERPRRLPRALALGAGALGIAAGTCGVASAASGSGGTSAAGTAAATAPSATTAPSQGAPWGQQRNDETPFTGDVASKVRELALAKAPGGTIVRVETDADGHAAYEAHMVDANGNPVTVYVDNSMNVVSGESRGSGGHGGAPTTGSTA
jgi:hypothetical protein